MSAIHLTRNPDPKINKWIPALLVLIVLMLTTIWWLERRTDYTAVPAVSPTTPPPPATTESAQDVNSVEDLSKLDAATVNAQQVAANTAAENALDTGELKSPITARPDFVSPVEWQILKGVSLQSDDSDAALTRLVNNLKFAKQQASWETLAGSKDVDKRHALARQLLRAIPARVANHDMNRGQAQQLQQTLLQDLISDPELRRQRATEEAKRIGVTFSIEKSK